MMNAAVNASLCSSLTRVHLLYGRNHAPRHPVHQQQPMIHTADNGVLLPQSHVLDKRTRAARGFALGDRVVCVRGSGAVPFGSRGTVIAMCGELVEVVRFQASPFLFPRGSL